MDAVSVKEEGQCAMQEFSFLLRLPAFQKYLITRGGIRMRKLVFLLILSLGLTGNAFAHFLTARLPELLEEFRTSESREGGSKDH